MSAVGAASVTVTRSQAGVWMHHIELRDVGQVDDEVCGWLAEAYASAG